MDSLTRWMLPQTRDVLERASRTSEELLLKARRHLDARLSSVGLEPSKICAVAVGSLGRREALAASDLDLMLIVDEDASFERLRRERGGLDAAGHPGAYDVLREGLSAALDGIDVSTGRSFMGPVKLADLTDLKKIGGDEDDRRALTRRVLVLTEAAQLGGGLRLREVRAQILNAYIQRTDRAHPLAFCNDIARYYRQVCIDYKLKHGSHETAWAESNVKLRHARKLWYFATALAIAAADVEAIAGGVEIRASLLDLLERPPCRRLADACSPADRIAAELLDRYAIYLDRMSQSSTREHLRRIVHEQRDADAVYALLQDNSRGLHAAMLRLLEEVKRAVRDRVLDWFLL